MKDRKSNQVPEQEKGVTLFYKYDHSNIKFSPTADKAKMIRMIKGINDIRFEGDLEKLKPGEIKTFLDKHLRWFKRYSADLPEWFKHTRKRKPSSFSIDQEDAFLSWLEENSEIAEKPADISTLFRDSTFEICKEMLEYVEITIAGKCALKGWGGKLFGAMTAIRQAGMLKHETITDTHLLEYFNQYLGTNYKPDFNKRTEGYKQGLDDAQRFLKLRYKK